MKNNEMERGNGTRNKVTMGENINEFSLSLYKVKEGNIKRIDIYTLF